MFNDTFLLHASSAIHPPLRRRGSVITSWLLDLTAAALIEDETLSKFTGRVSDSGEGRWTIHAAIDEGASANSFYRAL